MVKFATLTRVVRASGFSHRIRGYGIASKVLGIAWNPGFRSDSRIWVQCFGLEGNSVTPELNTPKNRTQHAELVKNGNKETCLVPLLLPNIRESFYETCFRELREETPFRTTRERVYRTLTATYTNNYTAGLALPLC